MSNPLRYLAAILATFALRAAFALRDSSRASKRGIKCDLPRRIKILSYGANLFPNGKVMVGEKSEEHLAANQLRNGLERVVIDFDHCTVHGSEKFKEFQKEGRTPIIYGSGRVNLIPGDGVWLEDMEWTPVGLRTACNFEDMALAFTVASGEVDLICSAAVPDARGHRRMLEVLAEKNAAPLRRGNGNKAT
jgi:hypothetical protein